MSLSTDFSEDDIISITFEVCSTRETGVAPASTFIKYLEGVTGHSREHSKLLLLYDMLDPKRQNILVDKETFHTVMKKWIAICYQDCISESEYERYRTMSNGNIQYNDMMPYLSDEDAEIFEGSGKDSEMICGLNSSIEEIKYTNQRMAEQLHGILKVMETSEETYLQLTDDIADLRDTVKSMEKPLRNFKNVYKELEDTKSKMANLHEENHMIRECVTSLKKGVESVTRLTALEEELKQKRGHSLVNVLQTLANLYSFLKSWDKTLKRLETFLEGPQLLAQSACSYRPNVQAEELGETNEHSEEGPFKAENQTSSSCMVNCDHCCLEAMNMNSANDYLGVGLSKTELQSLDAVYSWMLTQSEGKDQMLALSQAWKKVLSGKTLWNPEERLAAILDISKTMGKDSITLINEEKLLHKKVSEHNMQLNQLKGNQFTALKPKESVPKILKGFHENKLENSMANLYIQQIIQALQLWISETEGCFLLEEYAKGHCAKEENMPDFIESAEPSNCEDNGSTALIGMENKLPHCFSVEQQQISHQNNDKMDDEKYSAQEKHTLEMKNSKYNKEGAVCCESTFLLPLWFPCTTSSAIHFFHNEDSRLETSLIDALNLEQISTRKRCCWTFPNLFFPGHRQGSKENLLNKKWHACKPEHGQNNTRTLEVSSQASTENGVKYLHLPRYSAVTQRSWDHKAPQRLSSEVNLKQTFPSVHGLISPHCNLAGPLPPIMPTLPEDAEQSAERQHSILPSSVKSVQESPTDAGTCNTPSIVLPEYTSTPETDREKNLAFRSVSPHLRHSNRNTRTTASSLTSVDNAGHVIDLVNDQLPDVKISEEDRKKNLELLEEAKRVSERFLTRRGRKSRSSLSESPTAISPALSPCETPAPSRSNSFTLSSPTGSDTCATTLGSVSPLQNTTKGLTEQKENDQRKISEERLSPCTTNVESPKEKLSEQKENFDPHKVMENPSRSCPSGTDVSRVSLNRNTTICENELGKLFPKKQNDSPFKAPLQGPGMVTVDSKFKGPVPLLKDSKGSCKTEPGTRPPLLRAVSWEHAEPRIIEKAPFKSPSEDDNFFPISNKSSNLSNKTSAFKDLQIQVQPVRMQKLTKLREEHILMRNQNLVGLKLPELSEAAEQERGSSPVPFLQEDDDEVKSRCDVMPNIPDTLLRKLRVHTSISGSSPALTEREVENVFVQLSLAFRNDSYTLESRINQAERERNLAEENTEKELDHFKAAITSSAALWHHSEHREMYQRLLEDITVLNRLSSRLSSRAEMVGAVRQEKRMSKATEVMMQYVENLKRTYEKDHAELMEYKKLANQNSSRSYGSPEDGVPRTSRSMSLSVGKMPRRRVSVAVVSKFELPGQSTGTSPVPLMPSSLPESSNGKSNLTSTPVLPALVENGKSNGEPDSESTSSTQTQSGIDDINPETKAKIEEEAYNKGYQEGLKKTKELEELKEDDEDKINESPDDCVAGESDDEVSKEHSKLEVIIHYVQILYPKLHKHWNMLWVVAAIILIFAVVLGISTLYNYFSSCTELSDGPQMKATCSAVQQYSWWNSGFQHDQHRE